MSKELEILIETYFDAKNKQHELLKRKIKIDMELVDIEYGINEEEERMNALMKLILQNGGSEEQLNKLWTDIHKLKN